MCQEMDVGLQEGEKVHCCCRECHAKSAFAVAELPSECSDSFWPK